MHLPSTHSLVRPLVGRLALAASIGLFSFACSRQTAEAPATATAANGASTAICHLSAVGDSGVQGTVRFTSEAGGVRVMVDISGLTPGDHGFHVHEKGDCSAPDATSAGGHYNPTGAPHAARDAQSRHLGDLGNITADASGRAQTSFVDTHLQLTGANSIVGHAIIVHAGADDLTSQPSGNSGARVACGVIENSPTP